MPEQKILIIDDSIPSALCEKLSLLAAKPIWQFGWKSNVIADRFFFWHSHFAGGGVTNQSSCAAELDDHSSSPIYELWQALRSGLLKEHEPLRVYGNAHTFGTEGYCHKDNEDGENYFSTIYYAHSSWERNWGGELIFYDSNNDILEAVAAKPGRLVHFPGSILHKVSSLTKECTHLRASFVFKTKLSEV